VTLNPPEARYRQIANHIRRSIHEGAYAAGARIPTEQELRDTYNVSRDTARKAIAVLVAEGLVETIHGSGTVVRERRPVVTVTSAYVTQADGGARAQWTSELHRQGLDGSQQIREVSTVSTSAEIAGMLGLEAGAPAVLRRRTMLLDDEPVQLADSYYPADLAEGTELAQPAKLTGGTIAALERLGVPPVRFHEEISARMPTQDERTLLRLAAGVPVLRHIRVSYAAGDRAVEYSEAVMSSDRNVLAFDLPAAL
jgi:GntR family transcriptional regulator